MPERCFLNFFAIFFGIFLPGSSVNGIHDWNFFFSFSAHIIQFWLKIMPERVFFNFLNFLAFFLSEFPCTGRAWTEFRNKIFFFIFLGLYQPVLDRNKVGIKFFNFLNFFTIFYLEFSSSGCVGTEFGSKIFFPLSRPISSRFG